MQRNLLFHTEFKISIHLSKYTDISICLIVVYFFAGVKNKTKK